METQSNAFLGTEKVSRLMRKFALPCVISLLVGALYNIVDQIYIANASYLGSYGNAANTVVFPLTVIALAIATMLGDGCCAFVSLSLGAQNQQDAHKGVGTAIVALIASSLVLTAIYLIFLEPIVTMFGARVNEETFRLSKEYFFYIALGVPFYMFGQALNPIIRSDGSPRFAMITLLSGAILNCILDPIFIYTLHWGMMGAAVATVIGQIVSAVLALIYLFRMKAVRLCRNSFRVEGRVLRRILGLGLTSFLSQISIVLSMAAVLNMVKKYGAMDAIFGQEQYAQIPTAVLGIVMKFFQIIMSVLRNCVAAHAQAAHLLPHAQNIPDARIVAPAPLIVIPQPFGRAPQAHLRADGMVHIHAHGALPMMTHLHDIALQRVPMHAQQLFAALHAQIAQKQRAHALAGHAQHAGGIVGGVAGKGRIAGIEHIPGRAVDVQMLALAQDMLPAADLRSQRLIAVPGGQAARLADFQHPALWIVQVQRVQRKGFVAILQ